MSENLAGGLAQTTYLPALSYHPWQAALQGLAWVEEVQDLLPEEGDSSARRALALCRKKTLALSDKTRSLAQAVGLLKKELKAVGANSETSDLAARRAVQELAELVRLCGQGRHPWSQTREWAEDTGQLDGDLAHYQDALSLECHLTLARQPAHLVAGLCHLAENVAWAKAFQAGTLRHREVRAQASRRMLTQWQSLSCVQHRWATTLPWEWLGPTVRQLLEVTGEGSGCVLADALEEQGALFQGVFLDALREPSGDLPGHWVRLRLRQSLTGRA